VLILFSLPVSVKFPMTAKLHAGIIQVALGVATLLAYVPIELAVAHQVSQILCIRCCFHSLGHRLVL
jgi:heme A synthase